MSIGSKRVTIRIGDSLLELIREAVCRHNTQPGCTEVWTVSDFVLLAIRDKLNHGHRSARRDRQVDVTKVADNEPRVVEEF